MQNMYAFSADYHHLFQPVTIYIEEFDADNGRTYAFWPQWANGIGAAWAKLISIWWTRDIKGIN